MGERHREFIAEDLWLVILFVTAASAGIFGVVGLETLAGVVSILGFVVLFPVLLFWGEDIAAWLYEEETESADTDPLDTLKRRYAEGTIDEDEFERRLDVLLETDARADDIAHEREDVRDREG